MWHTGLHARKDAVIAALLLFASFAIEADDLPQLNPEDAAHFSELMSLAGEAQLSADQLTSVDQALKDSSPAVKASALALAYKYQPDQREALFPSLRETFHYRLPPETSVVPVDEFTATLRQIENANPSLSGQGHMLLGYLYFREHHLQFLPAGKEPISAATFLRTAFLTIVYKDSDIDVRALIKRFYEYQLSTPSNPE